MLGQLSLDRVNRYASLGVIPLMLLAIAVFSRAANGETTAPAPKEGTLVVANLRTGMLTFIDLSDDQRAELLLPGPPHELLFESGRLYVTLGRGNQLAEIDIQAKAILRTLKLDGEPHGIASLGGNLYVTLDKGNAVVIIDRATMTELRRLPTGDTPHVIAATESAIVLTDSRDNAVRQLEPSPATAPAGAQPEGIAIAGDRAVTADAMGGTLSIFDLPGLTSARSLPVGGSPVRVLAFDESRVLASVQGKDQLVLIDASAGKVLKRKSVSVRPDGLCLSEGGKYLAVAANGAGTVDFFATDTWAKAPGISLAAGLGACAWLPAR